MDTRPTISFFCPAYYDEGNLRAVVEKALAVLQRTASDYEIIVVEDGSPDATAAVADALADAHEKVRAIHHPVNKGYGAALQTGFAQANRFELVAFTDGDNQFDFAEVERMLPLLSDYDVVISYRKIKAYGVARKLISGVYNLIIRTLFGIPFRDISSSLKVFKRSVIDDIEITSDSPFVDAEIIVKALARGWKVHEVGIFSYPRVHGRSSSVKPANIVRTVREMLATWRVLRRRPEPASAVLSPGERATRTKPAAGRP